MTTATHAPQAAIVSGITVPDSKLAKEITEFVRDSETELLFNHSSRVYYFAALAGKRKQLHFDAELLYAGAMFHDLGLMPSHSTPNRFEVDGANAARNFLSQRGVAPQDVDKVWTAIALHTTPGVPEFMHPVIALLTCGVEMDVLGIAYDQYPDEIRKAVVAGSTPEPPSSRKISSRPSTTASTRNPTAPSAPSTPTSSPTRMRSSSATTSAPSSATRPGLPDHRALTDPLLASDIPLEPPPLERDNPSPRGPGPSTPGVIPSTATA